MSGFANTKADIAFLKSRLNKNLAAGEKLIGSEFWMTIKGYEKTICTCSYHSVAGNDTRRRGRLWSWRHEDQPARAIA